jgi:hypothetical protein
MELLPLARGLWRRRLLITAGAVVAIAIALGLGSPPPTTSAVAWTRVSLDTRTSQLVETTPRGADSLPWRASLMRHLMATDAMQRQLAQRLGVPPDQVQVVDPILAEPKVPASLPLRAAEAAGVSAAPYVLTVAMKNSSLPILSLEGAAPDPSRAKRLVEAAVQGLEAQAPSDGKYSSPIETVGSPWFEPFLVQDVTPVRAKTVVTHDPPIKSVGVPAFLFLAWCVCVAFMPRGRRRRLVIADAAQPRQAA